MSHKNYHNYQNYNKPNKVEDIVNESQVVEEPVVVKTEVTKEPVVEIVEPVVEIVEPVVEETIPAETIGVVTDCGKLRVRKAPNTSAEVVGEIDINSEVVIDEGESTADFYKVCTAAGLEGYCMKKFITVK